jgi:hypothetical protein
MADAVVPIPAEAVTRFIAAESRLYPLAVVDPDGYEHMITLVGLVVAELRRTSPDIDAVLNQRAELISALPTIGAGAGLRVDTLPPDAVVDAASAVRCRELQAAGAAEAKRTRIAAARAAGDEWLIDEPDPAEVMAGSYRRVELHLPTNTKLIASIDAGSGDAAPRYAVEFVPGEPAGAPHTERFPDRAAWLAAIERLRADVSARA